MAAPVATRTAAAASSQVRILKGRSKGKVGIVKAATDANVSVELHATQKTETLAKCVQRRRRDTLRHAPAPLP